MKRRKKSLYFLAISPEARKGPGEGIKALRAGQTDTARDVKERRQVKPLKQLLSAFLVKDNDESEKPKKKK